MHPSLTDEEIGRVAAAVHAFAPVALPLAGQREVEAVALGLAGGDPDLAAVALDDRAADRQAEPGPAGAALAVAAVEGLEDPLALLGAGSRGPSLCTNSAAAAVVGSRRRRGSTLPLRGLYLSALSRRFL